MLTTCLLKNQQQCLYLYQTKPFNFFSQWHSIFLKIVILISLMYKQKSPLVQFFH